MPYPATAYLKGYLKNVGHEVHQCDMSLDVILRLFSRQGLAHVFDLIANRGKKCSASEREVLEYFLSARTHYLSTIDSVLRFLQGKDESLALRVASRRWLPEGPRFLPLLEHPEILASFGTLGVRDRAKHLASLYLDDLSDLVREVADPDFQLSRYGERLAESQISFTPLQERLAAPPTLIDEAIAAQVQIYQEQFKPQVVGFTCPFPGNVYGALKAAQIFKQLNPQVKIVMGGGFVSTELRELSDPRIFQFVDALIFDDGQKPFELFLSRLESGEGSLLRTLILDQGQVTFHRGENTDVAFPAWPTPDFEGLDLSQYISMMEMPNPMHRLWSDFKWNKLILAHGCYWKKCTFCDISLDYIGRFEPARVESVVNHMVEVAAQTGVSGFHFVDEAAPPALLKALSRELIKRSHNFTWWGNIRFDHQYTREVCEQMAEAGCIAVTGGLEVASPRLLRLINKGVRLEQVATVTKNFYEAGIYVHAYLMYGFPSQTTQETVDSLEIVRQLFQGQCLHSAHWHRFVATAHSPVGQNPSHFGIHLQEVTVPSEGRFARNALEFTDSVPTDHERLGRGLRKALYNYLHGMGLNEDVRAWFDFPVPKPKVKKSWLKNIARV